MMSEFQVNKTQDNNTLKNQSGFIKKNNSKQEFNEKNSKPNVFNEQLLFNINTLNSNKINTLKSNKINLTHDLEDYEFIKNNLILLKLNYNHLIIYRQFLICLLLIEDNKINFLNKYDNTIFLNFYNVLLYSHINYDLINGEKIQKYFEIINNKYDINYFNKLKDMNLNTDIITTNINKNSNTYRLSLLKKPLEFVNKDKSITDEKIMYSWEDERLILYQIDSFDNKTKIISNIEEEKNEYNDEDDDYKPYCIFETKNKEEKEYFNNKCKEKFITSFNPYTTLNKEKVNDYYRLLINLGFKESFNDKTLKFDINKYYNSNLFEQFYPQKQEQLKKIITDVNKALEEVFNTDKVIENNQLYSNIPQRYPTKKNINKKNLLDNYQYGGNKDVYEKNLEFINIFKNYLNNNGKKLGDKTEKTYNNLNNIIKKFEDSTQETKDLLYYNNILLSYTDPQDILLDNKLKEAIKELLEDKQNKLKEIIEQHNNLKNEIIINFDKFNPNSLTQLLQLLQKFM